MRITEEIIHNFSDFAVRTIDSFVHSLLVASSLELKLPPDYEILPQPRPYLEYVLDDLLEEVLYNPQIASLFSEFLNHFLLVERYKQWNPKKALLEALSSLYQEENKRAKLFKEIPGDFDLSQAEIELKNRIRQFLSSLNVQEGVNQQFSRAMLSSLSIFGPEFFKRVNRNMHKALMPGEGIFNKQARKPTEALINHWQELKDIYKNYARDFVWLRYNAYLKIFNYFRQRLSDFEKEKRIVFLDELNKKARQFLTNQGLLPAEIYYKLSAVLYHYLIDEFQDTSILQWENIQALVEDALSKGGSLFYVGDKKQAIYHFRGGEVELFDLIKRRFSNQVAKIYDEVLLYNYRSQRVIVEFNNRIFSQENLRNFMRFFPELNSEFQRKILAVFKDSQQGLPQRDCEGGYVRLEAIEGENKQKAQENLNITLNQTIRQLKTRWDYRDIMILVRDNQESEELAEFLLQQGYPVCAPRTISVRNNYLIQEILSLLRFLNSPIDNLAFANFILGDIFIQATGLSGHRLQVWLEELRLGQQEGVLYTKFRLAFPDVWKQFLQYLFNVVGFLPVYDLVATILAKFGVQTNFPKFVGFTRRLLEILNSLQEQGKNSLSDFIEWLENAQEEDLFVVLPSGLDAIRILTIHKAKGLSSPVVILPYAALTIKIGQGSSGAPKIVQEAPEGLYLLYPQKDIVSSHPKLIPIYQRQYFQSILDELNCLYVGLTRASRELYIFVPKRVNRKDNSLISLLFEASQDIKEFGKRKGCLIMRRHSLDKPGKKSKLPSRLPQEAIASILRNQLVRPEQIIPLNKRCLVKRGEVLHQLLAEIEPSAYLEQPSSYVQRIKDACRFFHYTDDSQIMQCLDDFFRNPKMQRFLNPQFPACNEKEIVDQYGNLRRIDRLVFTEDKVLVIDYKTGEEYTEEHQEQIREYLNLIKQVYPDRLTEGWLIYVDTGETRLVNS
jgi:ATP-dependent exoDNAse (exonuclease V) beta subunit